MTPFCSTTYRRLGSARVDAIAVIALNPDAYGRNVASARDDEQGDSVRAQATATSDPSISTKVPAANPAGSRLYLLLKEDLAELVLLARLEDREHLITRLELGRADGDL